MESTVISTSYFDENKVSAYRKKILNPFLFRLYLLAKLPMGLLAGLRVVSLDRSHCSVAVPYKWLNKNPFNSTYFACQAMAAEMSTGVIALMAVNSTDIPISTYVVGLEAEFVKKAVDTTIFTCDEGEKIFDAIELALRSGEGVPLKVQTTGRDKSGNEIARFTIQWSFKAKGLKR